MGCDREPAAAADLAAPMTLAPTDLRIDCGGDQFAVSGPAPRLSWTLSVGLSQSGYEIEASVAGVPLPVVGADSAQHLFVPWPWTPLASAASVRWRVRVHDAARVSQWSTWADFETGLLDADWTARWISPVETADPGYGNRPAHLLSASVDVPAGVVSARLYATALGVYEAFVNGERAGSAELSPGASSYDRTLYAQAFDVTRSLRSGPNRLEILLSDGWYRGQVGAFRQPAGWGVTLGVRAELHLTRVEGDTLVVGTDEGWTSAPSTITQADLMAGQTTDLRLGTGEAVPVLVDQVTAPSLDWSPAPPVRTVETRPVVTFATVQDGVWLADFGQNASGWISLADLGPEGTRTTIDYGEHRGPDGDLDTAHLDAERPGEPSIPFVQRDVVVSDGGVAVFEPRHTIHGFRYARLTRPGGAIDPASLRMHVVHSDLTPVGSFACSDPDLSRLWDVARWSFRGNAVDIPTDCPTRERLGWTGDYGVFVSTATRFYDVSGFSRKWLRSVRDDQLDDGRIANFSPDGRRIKLHLDDQFAMLTGSAGWGDAVVSVPWELYVAYGDRDALAENWHAMVRWADWALDAARHARHPSRVARSAEPQPHERWIWDGTFHWGEWAEPKPKAADGTPVDALHTNPMAWFMADKGEVGTAYLYRTTSTLSRIAGILGHDAEAEGYAREASNVLAAWRTEFLDERGRTTADSQASYVRGLAYGLIPEELRAAAASRLVELIRAADNHLTTGFLSTADLLPTLADAGHAGVAYDVLFQRTEPSWLGMLDRGATTIWEDWDGVDDRGVAHASLNHYSKGAVVRFLHSHTLGLRQAAGSVAWESITVAPVPHAGLTWAEGSLDSPQGRIRVAWRVTGDEFGLVVDVPATTRAELVFPDGHTITVGPGHHEHTRALQLGS